MRLIFALSYLSIFLTACSRETGHEPVTATTSTRTSARVAHCADLDGSLPTKHGRFSGDPDAIWLTEGSPDRRMCLVTEFTFTDPKGKLWITPAQYRIDGASIPRALWAIVGSPYTGDYRRASIVHDKACDDAQGDKAKRRAADRMFYHACRAGGCSIRQSTILYLGVRIGALAATVPTWRDSMAAEERGPDIQATRSEQELVRNFQQIASRVLAQPETDDPEILEARTDDAVSATVDRDLRGQ